MNWKLLKPTTLKIIITIILGIAAQHSYLSTHPSIVCIMAPCNQPYPYGSMFFTFFWYVLALPFVLAEWFTTKYFHQIFWQLHLFTAQTFGLFSTIDNIALELDTAVLVIGIILTVVYLYCIVSLAVEGVRHFRKK